MSSTFCLYLTSMVLYKIDNGINTYHLRLDKKDMLISTYALENFSCCEPIWSSVFWAVS